jgi:hypothetical protein
MGAMKTGTRYAVSAVVLGTALVWSPAAKADNEERQMSLRVEIYELPAAKALEIQQQVSIHPDQTETVKGMKKMVESGKADFVTAVPILTPIGSRAKYQDVEVIPAIEDFEWNPDLKRLVPTFKNREVGTIFEVDPQVSEDGETLLVNFALEHHTGDPVTEKIAVPLGDGGESREVSIVRFQMKKITMKTNMKPGATTLIAAMEVNGEGTGEAGAGKGTERKRLAFLTADLVDPVDPVDPVSP